jgi:hypothetical protein
MNHSHGTRLERVSVNGAIGEQNQPRTGFNLLVDMAYTGLLGLKPGDEFDIKLGKNQIRLIPVGASDDED